ncbi:NfeD family protein [Chloroflexota bacterium]
MKSTIKDWLKVLVLLLDEAAAVVIVFFVLRFLKIEVPLPIMITVALLLGAICFVIHKAVIPTFHKKPATGGEELIGLEGEVIEPLTPVGVILARGEYWKAKSLSGDIRAGEEVEVIALNGLTLTVKHKNQ